MPGNWQKIGNISARDGIGVPVGGVRNDVLLKVGGTDYATAWGKIAYTDIDGKVPASALPEISIEPYVVDSQAEMLNLPAVPGRTAIRTDIGATFVLGEEPASDLGNWVEMVSRSDVTSVNSKIGAVDLTKDDVGLGQVDNTADADKPLATDTVRGLMSPDHKKKLNTATSGLVGSALVERDSAGRSRFQDPVNVLDVANKRYADGRAAEEARARLAIRAELSSTDMNEVVEPAHYPVSSTSGLTNTPLAGAASLLVLPLGPTHTGWLMQEWVNLSSNRVFRRSTNGGAPAWSGWRELAGVELATSAAAGLLSATDKDKLDDARSSNAANTLVLRDGSNRFSAGTPTSDSHVTTKAYTDERPYVRVDDTYRYMDITPRPASLSPAPGRYLVSGDSVGLPTIAGTRFMFLLEVFNPAPGVHIQQATPLGVTSSPSWVGDPARWEQAMTAGIMFTRRVLGTSASFRFSGWQMTGSTEKQHGGGVGILGVVGNPSVANAAILLFSAWEARTWIRWWIQDGEFRVEGLWGNRSGTGTLVNSCGQVRAEIAPEHLDMFFDIGSLPSRQGVAKVRQGDGNISAEWESSTTTSQTLGALRWNITISTTS